MEGFMGFRYGGYLKSTAGLIVLLFAIVQGSCTVNRVDKVYIGSMALKPFNFEEYARKKAGDKPYLGNTWGYEKKRSRSGNIVWYDHYFKKSAWPDTVGRAI